MSHVVLWSGGMDSTQLLHKLAVNNPTEMINAVTILGVGFGSNQSRAEKKARKDLLKEWKKRKITNIQHFEIKVDAKIKDEGFQMRIWFCYIMPSLKDGDKLHLAYLSSDGYNFFGTKEEFVNAFNGVCKLRDIKCELVFDFEATTKGQVMDALKGNKLLRLTSYCGQPKKDLKPCGKCMKCFSVKRWRKFPQIGIVT